MAPVLEPPDGGYPDPLAKGFVPWGRPKYASTIWINLAARLLLPELVGV